MALLRRRREWDRKLAKVAQVDAQVDRVLDEADLALPEAVLRDELD